jgi:hypothetical protein
MNKSTRNWFGIKKWTWGKIVISDKKTSDTTHESDTPTITYMMGFEDGRKGGRRLAAENLCIACDKKHGGWSDYDCKNKKTCWMYSSVLGDTASGEKGAI